MSKKHRYTYFYLVIILMLMMFGCSGSDTDTQENANITASRPTPPPDYQDLTIPIESNPETMSEGERVFQSNCASCHGEMGEGDGPVAGSLDPAPSDLKFTQDHLSDGYLYWRISEGGIGEPFYSSMPAWNNILSEDQIWKIIVYIRSL